MKKTFIPILLIIFLIIGLNALLAQKLQNSSEWNDPTDNIIMKISAEKTQYKVGEKIEIIFTFKNISEKPLIILDGTDVFRTWFHHFEFNNLNGKKIASASPELLWNEKALIETQLGPQETTQHKVIINNWKLAGLGHPYTNIGKEPRTIIIKGIYNVPVGLNLKKENIWWGRMVKSESIRIDIIE